MRFGLTISLVKCKWILTFSLGMAYLSGVFLPIFKTAKTRMPMIKMLHASRIRAMSTKQLKEDIKVISKPIFHKLGFDQVGFDGESLKTDGNGNVFAIFIEERKQISSYSISLRACAKYKLIDDFFPENEPGYILNSILDSRSISFDSYSQEELREILNHLILGSAISFLNSYDTESKIFENVLLSDYKKWVVTDKVSQFKAKFASAMIANDNEALRTYINEANTFLQKPWAAMYEEPIKRLCASVQASM